MSISTICPACGSDWCTGCACVVRRAEAAESALQAWREWVQFVFLDGGSLSSDDDGVLQTLVCKAVDRDVAAAKADQKARDVAIADEYDMYVARKINEAP